MDPWWQEEHWKTAARVGFWYEVWCSVALPAIVGCVALAAIFTVSATGSSAVSADTAPGPAQGPHRVHNPEVPANGDVDMHLRELWQVGDDSGDLIFGTVEQLVQDTEGNVYVLDGQLCHIPVFSPEGQHLRTIGREGEGPGEFHRPQDLFHVPGGNLGVTQVYPGKIVQLTPQGVPAGLFPLPSWGSLKVFRAMGDETKLVVTGSVPQGRGRDPGETVDRTFLKAFDPDGHEIHHYYHEDHFSRHGGMRFREPEFVGFEWRWALAQDGRVAVAPDFERYEVHIWAAEGTLELIIERPDFRPVRRTAEEKARRQRYYESITQWSPGSSFETEDIHPTINNVVFLEDGTLWVQSSRGTWRTADGVLAAFDVYARTGEFIRHVRLHLPGVPGEDQVFMVQNRVYVVTQFFNTMAPSEDLEFNLEPSRLIAYTMENDK